MNHGSDDDVGPSVAVADDAPLADSLSSSRSSSGGSSNASTKVVESPTAPFVIPDSFPVVVLGRTVERDLLRMAGVRAPATRDDLRQCVGDLTEKSLHIVLANVRRKFPRSQFAADEAGAQEWDDALAIALYTAESPIYRVVNGYLSEPQVTCGDLLPHVAPIVRRIYEAVQRRGIPYYGPAYRLIEACREKGSAEMQAAHANHEEYFAAGTSVRYNQFCSFTKTTSMVLHSLAMKRRKAKVILQSCDAVAGFDISQFSMFSNEGEVLCLPPTHFKVSYPPRLEGASVMVALQRDGAPVQFVSSLTSPVVPSDPNVLRDAIIRDIDTKFRSSECQRCVLYGTPGVGKTTLAHQFGEQWQTAVKEKPHHVRWFSAGTHDLLMADYQKFVQDCFGGLATRKTEDLEPAMRCLIASTPNVLFVFDGVSDESVVEEMLRRLLPSVSGHARVVPNVFVLMTSSSSGIYKTGCDSVALRGLHRMEVPVFTEAEVTTYLSQVLPERPGEVAVLQNSPLFQTHVLSLPKRLQWISALLRNRPTMAAEELVEACLGVRVTHELVDPVFTVVVDVLIAHCEDKRTKGWEMLELAARLADAPIPVELLRLTMQLSDDEAHEAIESLQQFSLAVVTFIACGAGGTALCVVVHSLAKEEAIRYTSQRSRSRSPSEAALIAALNTLAPVHSMARLCYPHAVGLLAQPDLYLSNPDPLTISTLQRHLAVHMREVGLYNAALNHALRAQDQQSLSETQPHLSAETATVLATIGNIYGDLGDYDQALKYAVEALEIRRKVLPDSHPDIAVSLNCCGNIYNHLRDQTLGLKYTIEALDMQYKLFGEDHACIADSLHSVAIAYAHRGEYKDALASALKALEMRRKVLPYPHPEMAATLNIIGNLYCHTGNHRQALKHSVDALAMLRKVLPEPHPDIATTLNSIAAFSGELGNHTESLTYALDALAMLRKVLPNPHPDIATTLGNIANIYSEIGDNRVALQYAFRALEMRRELLPDQHPSIAVSLTNIGNFYGALGDHAQALKHSQDAVEMLRKVHTSPHPQLAVSLVNHGERYGALGDHAQALKYCQDGLVMLCKVHTSPHPHIAASLEIIGKLYTALGNDELGLKFSTDALEVRRKMAASKRR